MDAVDGVRGTIVERYNVGPAIVSARSSERTLGTKQDLMQVVEVSGWSSPECLVNAAAQGRGDAEEEGRVQSGWV